MTAWPRWAVGSSASAHGDEHVDIDMIELFHEHISLHGCGRSTKAIVMRCSTWWRPDA